MTSEAEAMTRGTQTKSVAESFAVEPNEPSKISLNASHGLAPRVSRSSATTIPAPTTAIAML